MPAPMTSSRAALTFVLLSVFIDSLGFGIIIPSLPAVIMELTGEPVSTAADWSGYLMRCMRCCSSSWRRCWGI